MALSHIWPLNVRRVLALGLALVIAMGVGVTATSSASAEGGCGPLCELHPSSSPEPEHNGGQGSSADGVRPISQYLGDAGIAVAGAGIGSVAGAAAAPSGPVIAVGVQAFVTFHATVTLDQAGVDEGLARVVDEVIDFVSCWPPNVFAPDCD